MEFPNGKYAWMVKIGEKGQFVIPKEAREMFNLRPGSNILVLGDEKRGIAILPREMQSEYISRIFAELDGENSVGENNVGENNSFENSDVVENSESKGGTV